MSQNNGGGPGQPPPSTSNKTRPKTKRKKKKWILKPTIFIYLFLNIFSFPAFIAFCPSPTHFENENRDYFTALNKIIMTTTVYCRGHYCQYSTAVIVPVLFSRILMIP